MVDSATLAEEGAVLAARLGKEVGCHCGDTGKACCVVHQRYLCTHSGVVYQQRFTLHAIKDAWSRLVCVCRVDGLVKAVRQPLLTPFHWRLLFFLDPLLPSSRC